MKTHSSLKLLLLSGICLAAVSGVNAQATRTWVSGVGDDANPCSRTAPCKTFAGAISKTAAGGEINCIDAGGFGAVTITKAITIDGGGVHASILSSGTNGVVVNAAATDVVVLRNLSINGAGTGLNGVNILKAKNVLIENCQISGVTQVGINVVPNTAGASVIVHVNNSYLRKCTVGGIFAKPSVAGIVAFVHLEDVHANANTGFGVRAELGGSITASNSVASRNGGDGFSTFNATGAAGASLFLKGCVASGNGGNGVHSNGANSLVCVESSMINLNNGKGFARPSGTLQSSGNNAVIFNVVADDAITTVALK
jgi:hypothetical protein